MIDGQGDGPLSPVEVERVRRLQERLGIPLGDPTAACAAITHRSWINEHRGLGRADNERLEFLGDAVIDLAIGHRLMERFPRAQEGELSKLRAAVVNEDGLAIIAREVGLGELLLLGRGEEQSGGRAKPSLLADALEAVVGAAYLAGGLPAAFGLVDRLFGELMDHAASGTVGQDYKTRLQEVAQARFRATPIYRVVDEIGPDHSKTFRVQLELAGEALGKGEGRSKKDAEQAAAREALARLTRAPEPSSHPAAPSAPAPKRKKAPAPRAKKGPRVRAPAARRE